MLIHMAWCTFASQADFPTCAQECSFVDGSSVTLKTNEAAGTTDTAEAAGKPALCRSENTTAVAKLPLAQQPAEFFQELHGVWLSSYDLKTVHPAADLVPTAAAILPTLHASAVYDSAVAKGIHPLGIAPANCRGGKYAYAIPGNPTRVYAGLAKLPHQPATKFSIK